MAETIIDRLNLMFGPNRPNPLTMENMRGTVASDTALAKKLYPQPKISDAVRNSGLGKVFSGEQYGSFVDGPNQFRDEETLGGQIGRGILDFVVNPTLEAGRMLTSLPDEAINLAQAGYNISQLPTATAYNKEISGIVKALASQRERQKGQLRTVDRAKLGGINPSSGIIAGGPTYQQIPTSAEADAGLNAEIERLQGLSQSLGATPSDSGQRSVIGSDTDVALGSYGMVPMGLPPESFLGTEQDVQFVEGDDQLTSRIKDIISDDATVSGVGAEEGDGTTTEQSSGLGSTDDLQFLGEEQKGADTGGGTTTSDEATTGGGKSGEQINKDLYQGLLDQSLKSYNEAVGMAPPEAQTMQQYKDEFSKATGIDISGDPDNKAALTAFGLALMQNKAGKGFNVGKLLSETGKAGEKALPLIQEARKEARQAQIAAGKYALTESKTDTANRQKFLIDQAKYLRDRRDTILGAQVTRINQIEDREDKQDAAAALQSAKTRYDTAVKEIEWRQDAEKAFAEGKEIKNMLKQEPISGNKQFVIHKGMPKAGGQLILTDAQNDAKKFGRGYGNILEAQNTIDNSIRILREIEKSPEGSTAESIIESAQSLFKSVVPENPNAKIFEDIAIYNTDGSITLKQGISKEALLKSMRNGIISEYKRFLTQETGNGISEGDVKRIDELLGKPGAFKNIAEAIAGLQEARGIFENSKLEFEDSLAQFTDRTNYDSDEAFKLGSTTAQQGIFYGIGNRGDNYQAIDFSKLPIDDASGLPVFDLTK